MSRPQPAITVVIPLYNKAAHIVDTIKGVLAQTYAAKEIIVVNDGSTDGGEIALANCKFRNVRIINQKNAGVSVARNNGIHAATTEYIALLDADDQWLPHYLEEIAVLIKKFPEAGMFGTGYQYQDGRDHFSTPRLHHALCPSAPGIMVHFLQMMAEGDLPLTMSNIAIRRSMFEVIGGFPVGEPMGEDQDFLFRAALAKPIAYSPKVLALYVRDSENRACITHLPQTECPFSRRLSFMADCLPLPDATQQYLKKCSAAHLLHLVRRNFVANDLAAMKNLLDDPRCALKPYHRTYWLARYWLKNLISRVANHVKKAQKSTDFETQHVSTH